MVLAQNAHLSKAQCTQLCLLFYLQATQTEQAVASLHHLNAVPAGNQELLGALQQAGLASSRPRLSQERQQG